MKISKELKLEIDRLREDIQSSDIIQVKPYINGKINVSNPKWHLQIHLNTIENLINTPSPLDSKVEESINKIENKFIEIMKISNVMDLKHNNLMTLLSVNDLLNTIRQALVDKDNEIENYSRWYREQCNKVIDKVREINNLKDKLDKIEEVVRTTEGLFIKSEIKQILRDEDND